MDKGIRGLRLSVVGGSVGPTMTSTLDPLPLDGADDPAAVLAYARAQKRVEDDAARQVMRAAARWASMHSGESLVGPVDEWHESCLPLGGQGCPEVAEFAVWSSPPRWAGPPSPGAATCPTRSRATTGSRAAGPGSRPGSCRPGGWGSSPSAPSACPRRRPAFVDAKVAPFAHKIGPAQLGRLIEEAKARFDPEHTEAERLAAAQAGHFDIALGDVGVDGSGHGRRRPGPGRRPGPRDRGRRGRPPTAAPGFDRLPRRTPRQGGRQPGPQPTHPRPDRRIPASRPGAASGRWCCTSTSNTPPSSAPADSARLQETRGPVTAAQVRQWCANPDTEITVQPVLDLAEHLHVGSYEASARLKLQTQLRDLHLRVRVLLPPRRRLRLRPPRPPCRRDDGGPTCTCNLAPCCRSHHRAKTTGGWTYITVEPGVYLWRSPLGYQFLKDHTGTLDVTPDPERRELARTFTTHFGEP